ncbi:dual specificity protein phosphatase family protein [Candidatus Uabimicrobium amorphum]|uniref:Phosphatase n=1 Tax=Uabimicrobium amorphum TaxID=2596890 RepID=A0A5S9F700_UABAM|nr:dual specificity protein phosphatase family protein [Candidatus Uabimicrobium amorphum]BBM87189.1 phosphatase [Candidatus Uabimicrobium amorphum]
MTNIIISDWVFAVEQTQKKANYYRVISISAPEDSALSMGKEVVRLPDAREVLYLKFDDVTDELQGFALTLNGIVLATKDDCRRALQFLSQGGNIIVHCRAGVSRSTAIVLGFLLSLHADYNIAIDELFTIRACADPNTYILRLMTEILGRDEEFTLILEAIRRKQKASN